MGKCYEYLIPDEKKKIKTVTTLYRDRYDMAEDAKLAAKEAAEKLGAKSVEPGKYDLGLDPTNLYLTIHESAGPPTGIDPGRGYKDTLPGTQLRTLDK